MIARLLAAAALAAGLAGCATIKAPPYSPDFATLDRLKTVPLQKVAVGAVQPRDPAAAVNRINLRGSPLAAPQGTFAQYLEAALVQDLRELSLYDTAALTRIDATILKNTIDVSGVATGIGMMEVEFKVVRDGEVRHHRTYVATTQFASSFAGAIAIPKAQLEYGVLVRSLLSKVYSDPQFVEALRKGGR